MAHPPVWRRTSRPGSVLRRDGELLPAAPDSQLRRDAGLSHCEYFGAGAVVRRAGPGRDRMSTLAARTNATLSRLSHVVCPGPGAARPGGAGLLPGGRASDQRAPHRTGPRQGGTDSSRTRGARSPSSDRRAQPSASATTQRRRRRRAASPRSRGSARCRGTGCALRPNAACSSSTRSPASRVRLQLAPLRESNLLASQSARLLVLGVRVRRWCRWPARWSRGASWRPSGRCGRAASWLGRGDAMEDDGAGDDESGNPPEPVGVVEGAVPEGLADVEARDVTVYGGGDQGGRHGMWGISHGPVTGRLLAQMMVTGKQPEHIRPFDPRRRN